jgi:cysteine desulfurase
MIYLDCNATTPVDPEVREAICECLANVYGNPSSTHDAGKVAKTLMDEARRSVAAAIGCNPGEVFFTSGGTESNNLAIMGTALKRGKGHIISSQIEHPSVMNTLRHLMGLGFEVSYMGVDNQCRVSVEAVEAAIRKDTVLITIMHSNNETGTLQPIEEISSLASARGIPFHTDAAQSTGKVEVEAGMVDLMTIAGHKFYGPKGIGALYVRRGQEPVPIMYGAGHERGLRPGTENVAGIAGIGKAAEIAKRDLDTRVGDAMRLRGLLLGELQRGIGGLRLNGHPEYTLPGTLNVVIPGANSAELVSALGDRVALSAGSACHEGVNTPSSVLKAMGVSDEDALASIRISIGKGNTEEEIRAAAGILLETVSQKGRK